MTLPIDLGDRLAALAAGRQEAGDRIVAAARAADAGAVLQVGSLGAGGGDAFSDLDLVVVPGSRYAGLDLVRLFGDQIVAAVAAPRNAPRGGKYTGLCLQVAKAVLWLDLYEFPAETAAVPADAIIVYNDLDLPYSELGFVCLIAGHADTAAPAAAPAPATELLQIALAAKYLARGNRTLIVDKLPDAAGLSLDQIAPMLHQRLAAIDDPAMARATAGTGVLVDLADAARTRRSVR